MATLNVAHPDRLSQTRTFGRKAYGAHRPMTPAQKAANVAASIQQRQTEGRPRTYADYGIEHNPVQQALVERALAQQVAA